ncbi:hypothetical protein QQ045_000738 [Rhodiola kirilowii]
MINCMSRDVLERTDSYNLNRVGSPKQHTRLCFLKVERSWSGDMTRARYEQVMEDKAEESVRKATKKKGHHRRCQSELGADVAPKLVRSSGMRRDWSFEDLRNKIRNVGH